jgi:hypothetical protein
MLAKLINYAENRTAATKLPEDGTWPPEFSDAIRNYGDSNGEHVTGKEYAAIQIAVAKRAAAQAGTVTGIPWNATVTLGRPT